MRHFFCDSVYSILLFVRQCYQSLDNFPTTFSGNSVCNKMEAAELETRITNKCIQHLSARNIFTIANTESHPRACHFLNSAIPLHRFC